MEHGTVSQHAFCRFNELLSVELQGQAEHFISMYIYGLHPTRGALSVRHEEDDRTPALLPCVSLQA